MTMDFKKNMNLVLGMLMAVATPVSAMEYDSSACCEIKCCDNNASASGFTFYGEALYWRPELCGLEGAFGDTTIATTVDENANIVTTVIESDKMPHSKWDTGFRIGAEATMDSFNVELDWTKFNGKANFHDVDQFGDWKIKYDVIDLTFGYPVNLAKSFKFKPFIGVRFLEIHQKLTSHLETLFTSSIGNNTVFTDMDDKEDFRGVGPELGVDVNWNLGCNFSVYGSFAVATYYGEVKARNFDVDTFTQTISVSDGKRKRCFNNIATDAALGIRWDMYTNCCGCCVGFMLKLGVEQHRIYDFSQLGSDGTLSLDGGVFGAGITFSF